jgi:acetyl-CoA carboxylase carboxyltransferase component
MAKQGTGTKQKTVAGAIMTGTMADKVANLRAKRAQVELGGGKERIEKQHAAGKLTARERVARLVDGGSFQEMGLFARHRATHFGMAGKEMPADGVVTGCATIAGDWCIWRARILRWRAELPARFTATRLPT